jgi:hypothetical protein
LWNAFDHYVADIESNRDANRPDGVRRPGKYRATVSLIR